MEYADIIFEGVCPRTEQRNIKGSFIYIAITGKEERTMTMNLYTSGLFSGMSSSSSSSLGLYSMLGEYNNIRSGAYYKVLKGYYSTKTDTDNSSASNSNKVNTWQNKENSVTAGKAYSKVKSETSELMDAASKLTATGDKSLFAEKEKTVTDDTTGEKTTVKEVDTKAIRSAVKEFVSSYNNTLQAATDSGNTSIQRNAGYMTNQTKIFSRALEEVGITINEDQTLSLDEEKLEGAKTDNLKTIFNGSASYAAFTSQKASMISNAATLAASSASLYNNAGSYQNYGAGTSLDWYL